MVLKYKEVLKDIQVQVKDLFGCDVDESTLLTEIAADSLELTELIWKLEEKYDVSIPLNAKNIGDVVKFCFPEDLQLAA